RERTLERREQEVAAAERSAEQAAVQPRREALLIELAFVPGPRYTLAELEPTVVELGGTLALAGDEYEVARIGPSPLPHDRRRCAYLLARTPFART
ncbi:MAG: hypothetical protein NZL88_08660, partial [Gaiellaceae bacterium]|nr:hypothetical protein [Gaiellaceae bacterium]